MTAATLASGARPTGPGSGRRQRRRRPPRLHRRRRRKAWRVHPRQGPTSSPPEPSGRARERRDTSTRSLNYIGSATLNSVQRSWFQNHWVLVKLFWSLSRCSRKLSVPLVSTTSDIQLHGVIWPGQTAEKPRGWVWLGVSYHGKLRTSYNWPHGIKGSSVDVFKSAISLLLYPHGMDFCFIWRWIEKTEIQRPCTKGVRKYH